MKGMGIFLAGVLALSLGLGAFWWSRSLSSDDPGRVARPSSPREEIAWIKTEFGLTDGEFRKVEELHLDYVPRCDEYCRRVAASGQKVRRLASASGEMTRELAQALREDERTRLECREALLSHLYETAASMPAGKGRRFLELALPKVLAPEHPDVHSAVSHH